MLRELITFEVSGQTFGLDITLIREIRAWTPATRLPNVPDHVVGVVNLRGTVLPVIDLAVKLGWERTQVDARHAIIVTQLGSQACGLIVGSVSDIVTIPSEAMQPPPMTSSDPIVSFLDGVAAIDENMVMVLNLAAFGDGQELREAA